MNVPAATRVVCRGIVLGLCLLTAMLGCRLAGDSSRPSWVDGTSQAFPPTQYLVGVGRSDSRAEAEKHAYGAVSRIFSAEIAAHSKDWESYLVVEERAQQRSERRLTLESVIRVSTDKTLENVRILDVWFDQKERQYYALAGLEKAPAEAALLERIHDLDQTIAAQVSEAEQTPDKLTRVRNLKRAVKNLVLREAHNTDLRVIRTSGRGTSPAYHIVDLTQALERYLAENLAVAVHFSGEQSEPVRRALMEGLVKRGLSIAGASITSGDDRGARSLKTDLVVRGTVRLWPLTIPDPQFTYVRWCADAVIEDLTTNRVLGTVSKGGKEGHLTEREAVAKAVRVMQQEFSVDIARSIAGYVYGEVESPSGSGTPPGCPRAEHMGSTPGINS